MKGKNIIPAIQSVQASYLMLNVVYLLGAWRITSPLFIWGDNLSLSEAHMTADRHKTLQIKIHIL